MSLVDNLFKLELFVFPVWKSVNKTIKNADLETFKKRWPIWAQRLKFFPEIQGEIFSQIFYGQKDIFTTQQQDLLRVFFAHAKVNTNDDVISSTLSGLCLAHNWEALDEIGKHIPCNPSTQTIIACAMLHEASDSFWDGPLNRPRITIDFLSNYLSNATIKPYDDLQDLWCNSLFYSNDNWIKDISAYGIEIKKPRNDCYAVLPNFERKSLWEYAVLSTPNDIPLQHIVNLQEPQGSQLDVLFSRRYPMQAHTLYNLMKNGAPFFSALNNILQQPAPQVDYNNFMEIVRQTSPGVAPAFQEALEQINNEEQRQRLLETVDTSKNATRRKM